MTSPILFETPISDKVAERFWLLVDRRGPDECWLWLGARQAKGYGRLCYRSALVPAHRLSFGLHFGPIPSGMLVCHRCDNPPCCNPAHLFLGTPRDNAQDMTRKERGGTTKLSAEVVAEMRRDCRRGLTLSEVARRNHIARSTARRAVYGVGWSHISNPVDPDELQKSSKSRKLTPEGVENIRRLAEGGLSFHKIAAACGVDRAYVSRIVRGLRRA